MFVQDAVEWLIADSKSGVNDLDGAIQVSKNTWAVATWKRKGRNAKEASKDASREAC